MGEHIPSELTFLEPTIVCGQQGSSIEVGHFLFKVLFTRREGYPCARVTIASGLKAPLVYKQISQAGLLMCFVMLDILCNVEHLN